MRKYGLNKYQITEKIILRGLFEMWKVIYVAKDISLAKNIEKILKEKGIVAILNQLEMTRGELNGNVEILVPKCEVQEAIDIVSQALLYDNNLLNDID
ncbi:MAG TPA: hypothetical protein ENI51_05265 [Candidatus Atribacteria bacterium]|nr:hypothetical protein [Candidatus Atribacteria bacterium]